MPIDPKTTALLLIEYQNDVTTEGGALHNGVKAVMESTTMLANAQRLAAVARAAGVTVMLAPISLARGYREITSEPYGIRKGVVDTKAFVRASWGAESLIHSPHSEATLSDGGLRRRSPGRNSICS